MGTLDMVVPWVGVISGSSPDSSNRLLRWLLPRAWEDAVVDSRFRWSPERLSFGATYAGSRQRALRFNQILEQEGDSLVKPTRSPRESLEGAFEIVFRPFETLSAQADVVSVRDLLNPAKGGRRSRGSGSAARREP